MELCGARLALGQSTLGNFALDLRPLGTVADGLRGLDHGHGREVASRRAASTRSRYRTDCPPRSTSSKSPDTPRTLGWKFSLGASRRRIETLPVWVSDQVFCAEPVGFEPTEGLRPLHLSRVVH